jgi:hypothetical protein
MKLAHVTNVGLWMAHCHDSVAAQDQEGTCAMDVERMVHRMVAGHLVEQPDLDLATFAWWRSG